MWRLPPHRLFTHASAPWTHGQVPAGHFGSIHAISTAYDHNTLCCVALEKATPNQQANRYTLVVHMDESGTLRRPLVSPWGHNHPLHRVCRVSGGVHGDYAISPILIREMSNIHDNHNLSCVGSLEHTYRQMRCTRIVDLWPGLPRSDELLVSSGG